VPARCRFRSRLSPQDDFAAALETGPGANLPWRRQIPLTCWPKLATRAAYFTTGAVNVDGFELLATTKKRR
jgi:hypothetical protein